MVHRNVQTTDELEAIVAQTLDFGGGATEVMLEEVAKRATPGT